MEQLLKSFTFLEEEKIKNIIEEHEFDKDKRYAQKKLSAEVLKIIFGEKGENINYSKYFELSFDELV